MEQEVVSTVPSIFITSWGPNHDVIRRWVRQIETQPRATLDRLTIIQFNLWISNFKKWIFKISWLEYKKIGRILISYRPTVNDCCRNIVRQIYGKIFVLIVPPQTRGFWSKFKSHSRPRPNWRKTFFKPKGNYFFFFQNSILLNFIANLGVLHTFYKKIFDTFWSIMNYQKCPVHDQLWKNRLKSISTHSIIGRSSNES